MLKVSGGIKVHRQQCKARSMAIKSEVSERVIVHGGGRLGGFKMGSEANCPRLEGRSGLLMFPSALSCLVKLRLIFGLEGQP